MLNSFSQHVSYVIISTARGHKYEQHQRELVVTNQPHVVVFSSFYYFSALFFVFFFCLHHFFFYHAPLRAAAPTCMNGGGSSSSLLLNPCFFVQPLLLLLLLLVESSVYVIDTFTSTAAVHVSCLRKLPLSMLNWFDSCYFVLRLKPIIFLRVTKNVLCSTPPVTPPPLATTCYHHL